MPASDPETAFAAETLDVGGRTIAYRLLRPAPDPAAEERLPLVIYLHGSGERGTDCRRQLTHLVWVFSDPKVRRDRRCFVLAPQCPPHPEQWVDTPWNATAHTIPAEPTVAMRGVLSLLDHALAAWPVDRDRLYLVGMSMGGYGAWDLLMRRPAAFAGAVILCGGADVDRAASVAHVPVWLFHGAEDEVVPTRRTADMADALVAAGAEPRVTWYAGHGHGIWGEVAAEPDLLPWLFAQRRGAAGRDGP